MSTCMSVIDLSCHPSKNVSSPFLGCIPRQATSGPIWSDVWCFSWWPSMSPWPCHSTCSSWTSLCLGFSFWAPFFVLDFHSFITPSLVTRRKSENFLTSKFLSHHAFHFWSDTNLVAYLQTNPSHLFTTGWTIVAFHCWLRDLSYPASTTCFIAIRLKGKFTWSLSVVFVYPPSSSPCGTNFLNQTFVPFAPVYSLYSDVPEWFRLLIGSCRSNGPPFTLWASASSTWFWWAFSTFSAPFYMQDVFRSVSSPANVITGFKAIKSFTFWWSLPPSFTIKVLTKWLPIVLPTLAATYQSTTAMQPPPVVQLICLVNQANISEIIFSMLISGFIPCYRFSSLFLFVLFPPLPVLQMLLKLFLGWFFFLNSFLFQKWE